MLIDIRTASILLGLGDSTLRRWIAQGKLPVVRLGRRVLLRRDTVEHVIEAATRSSRTPSSRRAREEAP